MCGCWQLNTFRLKFRLSRTLEWIEREVGPPFPALRNGDGPSLTVSDQSCETTSGRQLNSRFSAMETFRYSQFCRNKKSFPWSRYNSHHNSFIKESFVQFFFPSFCWSVITSHQFWIRQPRLSPILTRKPKSKNLERKLNQKINLDPLPVLLMASLVSSISQSMTYYALLMRDESCLGLARKNDQHGFSWNFTTRPI